MTDLSHPLTPADCDLRGMQFMPLDVIRLFDSDFYAISTGDEFKAGLTLWGRSFLQIPAGSLPDDDRILAHLSGAGRGWSKVRKVALRGWLKCSDGRLYHPVVAEKANAAWTLRASFKARTTAATEARRQRHDQRDDQRSDIVTSNVTTNVTSTKGQRERESKPAKLNGESYPRAHAPTREEDPKTAEMRQWFERNLPSAAREYDPLKTGMADMKCVEGHPCVNGHFVDVIYDLATAEARMNTPASLAAWRPVIDWLAEGYEQTEILWLIRRFAARDDYRPPRSLAYFTKAIHEDCKTGTRPDGWGWHE